MDEHVHHMIDVVHHQPYQRVLMEIGIKHQKIIHHLIRAVICVQRWDDVQLL